MFSASVGQPLGETTSEQGSLTFLSFSVWNQTDKISQPCRTDSAVFHSESEAGSPATFSILPVTESPEWN